MTVLVTYASKHGSTQGIAERRRRQRDGDHVHSASSHALSTRLRDRLR